MDEYATEGPWEQSDRHMIRLLVLIRQEMGVPNANSVFPEPER